MAAESYEKAPENPLFAAHSALLRLEADIATDPVLSAQFLDGAKKFITKPGFLGAKGLALGLGFGLDVVSRVGTGVFNFIREAIAKKGNVGFRAGMAIGENMLDFDPKKEK